MEQRYQAVLEVLAGVTVVDVARFGGPRRRRTRVGNPSPRSPGPPPGMSSEPGATGVRNSEVGVPLEGTSVARGELSPREWN